MSELLSDYWLSRRAELDAEIQRLRAALELIAHNGNSDDWSREVARKVCVQTQNGGDQPLPLHAKMPC